MELSKVGDSKDTLVVVECEEIPINNNQQINNTSITNEIMEHNIIDNDDGYSESYVEDSNYYSFILPKEYRDLLSERKKNIIKTIFYIQVFCIILTCMAFFAFIMCLIHIFVFILSDTLIFPAKWITIEKDIHLSSFMVNQSNYQIYHNNLTRYDDIIIISNDTRFSLFSLNYGNDICNASIESNTTKNIANTMLFYEYKTDPFNMNYLECTNNKNNINQDFYDPLVFLFLYTMLFIIAVSSCVCICVRSCIRDIIYEEYFKKRQ
jgi:hypothetical protein